MNNYIPVRPVVGIGIKSLESIVIFIMGSLLQETPGAESHITIVTLPKGASDLPDWTTFITKEKRMGHSQGHVAYNLVLIK